MTTICLPGMMAVGAELNFGTMELAIAHDEIQEEHAKHKAIVDG